ncbi:TPA: O-antigen ligase family protein [Klebsiella aerogenes]|nr:O-antigen ligase family protein [Klebsiella aerogenes]
MRRRWLVMLVVAALLQGLLVMKQALYPTLLQAHGYAGRPLGTFIQPNLLGSFLATGLVCALTLARTVRDNRVRLLGSVALVVLPGVLVLVQSRAGMLGALLAVVLWRVPQEEGANLAGVVSARRSSSLMMAGVVLGLLWLYAAPWLFPGHSLRLISKDSSDSARLYMLRLTWQLIQAHPFTGHGYGTFEGLFGQMAQTRPPGLEADTVTHPHNELLYTWMEGGLVAIAGLLLMVVAILRRLWSRGGAGLAGLALLLPLAVHINLEYPLYQSLTHGLLLVLLLVITGPDATVDIPVSFWPVPDATPATRTHRLLWRMAPAWLACLVVLFMLSGLVSQQRLAHLERAGLQPLVTREAVTLSGLPNPYAVWERLDFDRHVALLLRYNRTQDPQLLTQFRNWATVWLRYHNDPQVYHSLLMIDLAQQRPGTEALCQQAHGRWPTRPDFICSMKDMR